MWVGVNLSAQSHSISCSCAQTLFIYWIVSQSTIDWLFRCCTEQNVNQCILNGHGMFHSLLLWSFKITNNICFGLGTVHVNRSTLWIKPSVWKYILVFYHNNHWRTIHQFHHNDPAISRLLEPTLNPVLLTREGGGCTSLGHSHPNSLPFSLTHTQLNIFAYKNDQWNIFSELIVWTSRSSFVTRGHALQPGAYSRRGARDF